MKVVELIKKLNEIGYDENTELEFSFTDNDTGEWYVVPFEKFWYGEELTGDPYCKDIIDIGIQVDTAKEYINAKIEGYLDKVVGKLNDIIYGGL